MGTYKLLLLVAIIATTCSKTQAIDCYTCTYQWIVQPNENPGTCYNRPPNSDLLTYPDNIEDPFIQGIARNNSEIGSVTDRISKAYHRAYVKKMQTSGRATPEDRATYRVLCTSYVLKVEDPDTNYGMVRQAWPFIDPANYINKCKNELPAEIRESLEEEGLLQYVKEQKSCYCDSDGCNREMIGLSSSQRLSATYMLYTALLGVTASYNMMKV